MNTLPLCPNCNTPNPLTSVFCSQCGQKLPWGDTIAPQPYESQLPPLPSQPYHAPQTNWTIPQQPVPVKKPVHTWQWAVLGVFVVMMGIGAITSSQDEAKKEAANTAQEAREAAYRKTPAYRAHVKAQAIARRAEAARRSKALRETKAQEAKAQASEIEIVRQNAESIEKLLRKANSTSDGQMFSGYDVEEGDKLTLTTTPDFDALPYRSRLQIATLLYNGWSALCERTTNHKVALFHMNDIAGNEVGGTGVLSGVWVVDK